MPLTMESDIRFVKGVGEARMKLYKKLDIATVEDLLYHLPRSYVDLTAPKNILELPLAETGAVRCVVASKSREQRIRSGLSVWKVTAVDSVSSLTITFFNAKYTVENLHENEEYIFYGKMGGTLLRREMNAPAVYRLSDSGLVPVYPLTAGVTSKSVGSHVLSALAALGELPESLPQSLRQQYGLCTLDFALRTIHHPHTMAEAEIARRRLIFEELLCLGLGFARLKQGQQKRTVTPMEQKDISAFWQSLPFAPTGAQRRAVKEALADLCSPKPMNRLVQGDVGSGKTLVAAACCYFAFLNNRQSALMAPTEILAEQHARSLTPLLEPLGMRVGLLTGSMTAKQKREVKAALAKGEIHLCVGTHALLTGDTEFLRLGLCVTDEQHRFGVAQRMGLGQKGQEAGTLVMSATPIPRTLALIIYGDLDLSVIDELPAGRQKIDTFLIDSTKRERAFGYVRKHLDAGFQGYIVCPLVEENEETLADGRKAAAAYEKELADGPFGNYRVGLLHGKMKAAEKEAAMRAFSTGEIQLLVATTVIEVGIDVPNAVIMMIENAERFGLSQLHQLRGRVGRGSQKSTCILLSDSSGEDTQRRLKYLCASTDGFKIAEYDLELRGPGDFFGMRQHGLPQMKVADLSQDSKVLYETQKAVEELAQTDPQLKNCPALRRRVDKMMGLAAAL
ncbi:MAG: ATP-dependent DNA helicase RecG [Angelakisella sp.]|nr:ATP-dependent DNA helicase RecG [Angelakisella sp.]